jgi:hypothetical protein
MCMKKIGFLCAHFHTGINTDLANLGVELDT